MPSALGKGTKVPLLALPPVTRTSPASEKRVFCERVDHPIGKTIVAQDQVVRELERRLLPLPAPKQRKGATKN